MYPADLPTIRNSQSGGIAPPADDAVLPTDDSSDTCNIHLSQTPVPQSFPRVRGYLIQSLIGSGGMGVVYKARHIDLQRTVALKMMHDSATEDREAHQRFQAEAEAVARVQHPNIIQVFEIGTVLGLPGEQKPRPFLSLEFMDGGSLTRHTESPQSPAFAARMVEKLARAAHAAHVLGVVHRDLKPANVLLAKDGEPKIADFGVAKLSGENERLLTQAGMTVGTPEYMAPEQAGGEDSGPAADIYSLGVILYQLLTARLPFHGSNPVDTMYLVRSEEPVSPRRFQPSLPRDLETICLKCLAKKPSRRYDTAEALAEDLSRWAEGRTIQARPVGSIERMAMWVKRNPTVAALSVAIVLVAMIGVAGVVMQWQEAKDEAWKAREQAAIADRERHDAVRGSYRSNITSASGAIQLFNPRMARRALDEAPGEHRNWEWRYYDNRLDTSRLTLGGGPDTKLVNWINSSTGGTMALMVDDESTIHLYDARNEKRIAQFPRAPEYARSTFDPRGGRIGIVVNEPNAQRIAIRDLNGAECDPRFRAFEKGIHHHMYSPDGSQLVVETNDGTVHVFDPDSGKPLHTWKPHDNFLNGIGFSKDSTHMATAGGGDRTVRIWDSKTFECLLTLDAHHTANADGVAFNASGDRLVVMSSYPANKMWMWELPSGKFVAEMAGHTNQIKRYGFNADGSRFMSASLDQSVKFWDGRTGKHIQTQRKHTGWIADADFSPDGKLVATASHDRTVRLWETETGDPITCLFGHTEEVLSVRFSADGESIVTGSRDATVKLWNTRDAIADSRIRGHSNFVYGVAFHPDGERVASASWDGTVRIWHATSGRELMKFVCGNSEIVSHVAIHPAGKLIAAINRGNAVHLWDIDSGELVHKWTMPSSSWQDSRLAFSPDGKWLAASDDRFIIHVFDVENRSEGFQLKGHTNRARDLAFSPDGKWLATASEIEDRTVHIWDLATRECVKLLAGHKERVYSLAFNRAGTLLASGSTDGAIRLWDVGGWEGKGVMEHGSSVFGLAFSKDGTRLASACADNTVRLWDVEMRHEVAELRGHTDYVHSVAFSPDGTRLVSGSGDRTLRIWDTLSHRERINATPTRP